MRGFRRVALVVPSIREASFKRFVDEWSRTIYANSNIFERCHLILVEDNPEPTFEIGDLGVLATTPDHYSWRDIEERLGKDSWVIPRRSDTVRSFGYWAAWRDGFEYVMTLDDDCYPAMGYAAPDLAHLEAITGRSRWFNTLTSVKPRGVPFKNTGVGDRVLMNHGLWTNVLDYDAPTQLVDPAEETFAHDSRTIPANMYYPMCGMNVMWRADMTFAMYHLLMGRAIYDIPGNENFRADSGPDDLLVLPFDRFGDIWAGLLSKRLLDEYCYSVTTGVPYIHHDRASDPFMNLRKEANGLQVNERLWELVDRAHLHSVIEWNSPLYGYAAICDGTFRQAEKEWPEHAAYFRLLMKACETWCHLFMVDGSPPVLQSPP